LRHAVAIPRRASLKRKALEDYRAIVGDDLIASVRDLAIDLRGLRVLELSATATGAGVAEMLSSLMPLERDAGLDAEWHILAGNARFFNVTKTIHNGLQGMPGELSLSARNEYLDHNEATAEALDDRWDVVVVHDPQPAAVRHYATHVSPWSDRWRPTIRRAGRSMSGSSTRPWPSRVACCSRTKWVSHITRSTPFNGWPMWRSKKSSREGFGLVVSETLRAHLQLLAETVA
jgi:hypothetical protein